MAERPVPQPPTEDGRLPPYREGQSYLDHTERMLLDLFQDLRGLLQSPDLDGSERCAAAGIALACCETMQALAETTNPEADSDPTDAARWVPLADEEEDDDIDPPEPRRFRRR